jgi:AAA15 family ATPase/GTPase
MINEIVINGYRCLDNFKIDGMTKFNLIVGPNNSGKSSLLEALFMHFGPLNFRILFSILTFREGGFQTNPHYIVEQMKWFFTDPMNRKNFEISITGNWGKIKRKTTISLSKYLGYEDTSRQLQQITNKVVPISDKIEILEPGESKGITIGTFSFSFESNKHKRLEHKVEINTEESLKLGPPPIETDVKAVFSDPFLHRRLGAGLEEYDKSVKSGHHTKCLKLLQEVDPDITNVSILLAAGGIPQLYVDHKRTGLAPISTLGDGIRRIYLLATQFVQCKGGVLLIDELEDSVHWLALNQFINWIVDAANELNVQIFATTHSLESIDAVLASKLSKSKELSLFKLKKQNGRITCRKIRGDTLETIRYELGQDVRW